MTGGLRAWLKMGRKRITDQQYIDEIKRVAALLDTDYVSTNDYDKNAKYSSDKASKRFDGWANYAKTAGLKNREENDDITDQTFTRLKVIEKTNNKNKHGNYLWKCECSCPEHNIIYATIHDLRSKIVQSCGCLKKEVLARPEQREALKEGYAKKTHKSGIRYPDFKKKPMKNNTSGYKGVTKKGNKWMAQLVVKGKHYYMYGFDTPEDAYYNGRLKLEEEHLPEDFRDNLGNKYKKNKKGRKLLDLKGQKFGRWTVLYEAERKGYERFWMCECSCEKHTRRAVSQGALRSGMSKSCGCLSVETFTKMANDPKIRAKVKDAQTNRKVDPRSTTGYRGISYSKKDNRYVVKLYKNRKLYYGGSHDDLESAIVEQKKIIAEINKESHSPD